MIIIIKIGEEWRSNFSPGKSEGEKNKQKLSIGCGVWERQRTMIFGGQVRFFFFIFFPSTKRKKYDQINEKKNKKNKNKSVDGGYQILPDKIKNKGK